jgi:archaellin
MPRAKKTTTETVEKPKVKKTGKRNTQKEMGVAVNVTVIIPSGPCPVELKNTTYKSVVQWCNKITEHYKSKNSTLEKSGYKYYVRYFYPPYTEEYKEVIAHVEKCIEDGDHND